MSYCARDDVKQRLAIDLTETKWDTEIDNYVYDGYDWINRQLSQHGVFVPLSTVPPVIKSINADYAAGELQENKLAPGKESFFSIRCEKKMANYIQTDVLHQGIGKVEI